MKRWLRREVQEFGLYIVPLIFILGFLVIKLLPYVLYSQDVIPPESLTGVYDMRNTEGSYYGRTVTSQNLNRSMLAYSILGTTSEPKRIEIDLTNQHLYAFEGNNKVYDVVISSGKWGKTPKGNFHIWGKMRYVTLEGGSKFFNTYYYLPNVPYVLYFTNDDYRPEEGLNIHGTYWHQTFGETITHGNIDIPINDAEKLFYWANPTVGETQSTVISDKNPGTPVIIY